MWQGPEGTRFGDDVGPAWHRELQHVGNESLPASCPRGPQGPALPLLMTLPVVTCTCKDLGGLHATCVAGTQTGVGLGLTAVCGDRRGDGTVCTVSLWPLFQLLGVQELRSTCSRNQGATGPLGNQGHHC